MDEQKLQEMYRLTRENNHMLHAMRRNAFWGGLVKFVFYVLVLVIAPLWVYSTYFAPLVNQALKTMQQARGTSAQAQTQFDSFQDTLKQLESKIPGFSSTSTR